MQKFISAARRTRDLWFGSNALSEISKAAAKAIAEGGGQLIFPAPSAAADLVENSPLNVANVVLAELKAADPKAVVEMAREAARNRWLGYACEALEKARNAIREDIWDDQVNDVMELNAAWVISTGDYKLDRAKLMRILAGRKHCFDFKPAKGRSGVPKSSLDGLRESVVKIDAVGIPLAAGEQLDVVGVVKRIAGGNQSYPSVARIAADPWLRGLSEEDRGMLINGYKNLPASAKTTIDVRKYPQFANFPFEGTVCFPSRYADMKNEGVTDESLEPMRKTIASLKFGESDPYLAVLVADGDRVGAALSAIDSADGHRKFSTQLTTFSSQAAKTIPEFNGVAIYCGGDDVLALIPVDRAIECAAELAKQFKETMARFKASEGSPPTLSVGLAIGHYMEPLEDLLNYGRSAEQHAKNPTTADSGQPSRNALAIHLHKRGGGPVHFRGNWDGLPHKLLLNLAASLNAGAISHRIASELEHLSRTYDGWPAETVNAAIVKDALRILAAKKPRAGVGGKEMEILKNIVRDNVRNAADLRRMACAILIARQIANGLRQAAGEKDERGAR